MTDEEMAREGWDHHRRKPPVFVLKNGDRLYPSMDPEGNGPGAIFGINDDGERFYLSPE